MAGGSQYKDVGAREASSRLKMRISAQSYLRWALQTPDEHETPSFGQSPAQSSPLSTNCLYFCSNWYTRCVSCSAKLWWSPPQLCFCVGWIKRPGMATGEEVMHLLKWLERRSRSCKPKWNQTHSISMIQIKYRCPMFYCLCWSQP